jgi:hypothetical protein
MSERITALATEIVDKASAALEARDASLVFWDRARIERFLAESRAGNGNITGEIDAGRLWEALRRLVGASYVLTPSRLRPDQQAMLTHLANQETRVGEVA